MLCWFSTWNVFRIFSLNGLDPGLGLYTFLEPAEYHLHLGYVTCLFTFTPMLGFLWPWQEEKNGLSLFQCQLALVRSGSLESGGWIKRQSVFERAEP